MPQSTPERRKRWGIDDVKATRFLMRRGYERNRAWQWKKPTRDHTITDEESDAIIFLIQEWDDGGLVTDDEWYLAAAQP